MKTLPKQYDYVKVMFIAIGSLGEIKIHSAH